MRSGLPGRALLALCASALGVVLAAVPPARASQPDLPVPADATAPMPAPAGGRPRVALVLSGGGARGIAHVGVLKVLERLRVPVDMVVGTSMGAIVGGLYASGMSAEVLEREFSALDWDEVFATRVPRQQLSQRRKEEDFETAAALELGMRDGELKLPLGAVSSRGLERLLRRYTLPVRQVGHFDRLPIPFRAVATNLETGEPVVFERGDLAQALRASMSVPGVFAPTEVDGRILGDGGLVDNLPVGVARALGADIVIAVNIGTPLGSRDTLGSLLGVTQQMINILTEQNVQRSITSLKSTDVLLAPDLQGYTSADFARAPELIAAGELYAQSLALERLAPLAVGEEDYAAWRASLQREQPLPQRLAFVRFQGTETTNPQRLASQMESRPGQPFDRAKAERDAQALAATGDYLRADYRLETSPEGEGLVFDLEEKGWGPNYLRVGLDLRSDFSGDGDFNIKIAHNRHWLDQRGAEWRNLVQVGSQPRWFTEWYQPLNWNVGLATDWFVAVYADVRRDKLTLYDLHARDEIGRFRRTDARFGIDLGQPWGRWGEVRLGIAREVWRNRPELLGAGYQGPRDAQIWRETGLRAALVVDQLDHANFPQHGWRVVADALWGHREGSGEAERFNRYRLSGTVAETWGKHTLNLHVATEQAGQTGAEGQGRYTLGGFQRLSGYRPGQIEGNYLLFLRTAYYWRLASPPVFSRAFFAGGTLEAGNAWNERGEIRLGGLRTGMSLFLGADTGLGPIYLALTHAPEGQTGLYLLVGRP